MNEGIHLDLDTWIVPGQIRKANLCRGLGNRYTPAGTEVLHWYMIITSITNLASLLTLFVCTIYCIGASTRDLDNWPLENRVP